ncbi:MAG: AraC family transcriptional regulator [Rhodobacteraceae bacterium]|nr:MAG: AraC family transcriptional regulator [Paracoccaceae bacterium]
MTTYYDTADVSFNRQFDYWREAVCETYVKLGCSTDTKQCFSGRINVDHHSILSISRIGGSAHSVTRRIKDIGQATEAYFLLSLQISQSTQISQFGVETILNKGDMRFYSSTDPYEVKVEDGFSKLVIQLPKEKLLSRIPNAEMLVTQKIDGQSYIGQLIGKSIIDFSEYASKQELIVQALIQDTLLDLIATALITNTNDRIELTSPEQQTILRTKYFIRNNLSNIELDRHLISNEIGISVRHLNSIFAKEQTSISKFVRDMRLNTIADEMLDARYMKLSISEIALKYGFQNLQHFSTIFRKKFNKSPRNFRQQG